MRHPEKGCKNTKEGHKDESTGCKKCEVAPKINPEIDSPGPMKDTI